MNRAEKAIVIGLAIYSAAGLAYAANQNFEAFVISRSGTTQPLGGADYVPVVQGTTTFHMPANLFVTTTDTQTLSNKAINGSNNVLTVRAASDITGTLPFSIGGLGITTGTSGGFPCFTSSTVIASSVAMTGNAPMIGGGAGSCPTVGSRTGNTTVFVTNTGSNTSGHGGSWDASGNWVDNANAPFTNAAQTWTGQQTFSSVIGTQNNQSGTTYSLVSADCGKPVYFTNALPITVTLPNSLLVGCTIALEQGGAGQITVVPGAGATGPSNPHSYTKTFAQSAVIGLAVDTNSGGSAAHWVLTGDGA